MSYPLDEILLLCLLAVLAGADNFIEIALFGVKKLDFLRRFRPFKDEPPDDVRGLASDGRRCGQRLQPVPSVPLVRAMVGPAGGEDPAWPVAGGVRAGGRAAGHRHRRLRRTSPRRQDLRHGDLARCGALEPQRLRQGRGLALAVVAGGGQTRLRQAHMGLAVPDDPEPLRADRYQAAAAAPDTAREG